MSSLNIFTDGGSRGNPGKAASAFVITDQDNNIIASKSIYLGIATNNVAEYNALIAALEEISKLENDFDSLHVYSDSELMINQLKGVYKIKNDTLKELSIKVKKLIADINCAITFYSIPREKNKTADMLVNKELDIH